MALSSVITSFKSSTICGNLNAGAMLLVIFELSFIAFTLRGVEYAFPVHHAVFPSTIVVVACFSLVHASAIRFISFPLSRVGGFTFPNIGALSTLFSIEEASSVFVTIGKIGYTFACAFAILILTFVNITIFEPIYAFSVLVIVFPITDIHVSISVIIGAESIALVVKPIAFVFCAIKPIKRTFSLFLIIDPMTLVRSTTYVCVGAFTITFVVFPIA